MLITIASSLLVLLGFIPYAMFALRGPVRPNPISWLIWSLNGTVLCVGHFLAGGALSTAVVPIVHCLGPALIAWLAISQLVEEKRALSRMEVACGQCAALGFCLSILTGNAAFALLFGLAVECFAALPTVFHLWEKPEEECLSAWVLFFLGSALNVAAAPAGPVGALIVPWFFVVQTGTIALLLSAKRMQLRTV